MFVGRVDAPLTVVRPSQIRTCGFSASGSVRNELFTLSFIYSDIDPRSYQRIAVIQRFQSFLKSGLLPCAAHRSLPVHDLFPERNLIPDIVIYEPIHSFQATQPLFQFLFFGLCNFPGNCVFLYWIILRVMLVDQIQ